MRAAVDGGLVAQSPCQSVALPRIERQEVPFLTPAEILTLADAMAARYRAMVIFDAYCGLRMGELAGLRCGRVDLLRRQVRVIETAGRGEGPAALQRAQDLGRQPRRPFRHQSRARSQGTSTASRAEGRTIWSSWTRRRRVPGQRVAGSSLAAGDQSTGRGAAAPARPATHGRIALDRRRCEPEADRHVGWTHLRRARPRPLRAPAAGPRGGGTGHLGRLREGTARARWSPSCATNAEKFRGVFAG